AVAKSLKDGRHDKLSEEDALSLVATEYAYGSPNIVDILAARFGKDKRPGFQVLTAAVSPERLAAPDERTLTPVTRYARWLSQGRRAGDEKPGAFGNGALARLVAFHDLEGAWNPNSPFWGEATAEECRRIVKMVQDTDAPVLSWA